MNMKKRALAFVLVLFLFVAFAIVYIFSELYSESEAPEIVVTDAMKFKEEYEKVNGEKQGENTIRELSISKENPFIYATDAEIVERINNKETFVVYFGFATCPWCRSVLPSLIKSANENKIDTIYYVDVLNIRDKYELDENNKAVKTKEGTEGYYDLLEALDSVLDVYSPLTYVNKKGKTKTVKIDEKRIYAPNVVVVKNGNPMALETGICESQTDAFMELSDEMLETTEYKFDCIFKSLSDDAENVCSKDENIC